MKNTKKGFTLVELLVVIAILAILATVSVVGYTSFVQKADESAADQEIHQIETIIDNALILNDVTYFAKTADSTTKYIKITKSNNSGTVTITVSEETTKPGNGAIDITNDIGAELIAKLSFESGALKYGYKASSTTKQQQLYP